MDTIYRLTVTKIESQNDQKYEDNEVGNPEPTGEWLEHTTETLVYSQDFDPSPSTSFRTVGTDEGRLATDKWLRGLIHYLNGVDRVVDIACAEAVQGRMSEVFGLLSSMDNRLTKALNRLVRKVSPAVPTKKKAGKS